MTFKKITLCVLALLPLAAPAKAESPFSSRLAALERHEGGHIGVAAINTATGRRLTYRANERFAMCSTHKLLLVAAVLSSVDVGKETLGRMIHFEPAKLDSYAPVVRQHLAAGQMSVGELSAAAIEYSDNAATNLLLDSIGGVNAFNRYVRSLGDKTTRLDRREPALNSNLPGDPRDTTTPLAMVSTARKLLVGNTLSRDSRERLVAWLIGNTTGGGKLRASVPSEWKIGDKTGSGDNGASSDVAIIWPSKRSPFLIAVYYTGASSSAEQQSAVIAQAGRIVGETFYPDR
jgi:beta-lactamase class A